MTLVSVILPTWQRHELLFNRALPSVWEQIHTDLQVIVCSDGPDPVLRKLIEGVDVTYVEVAHHDEHRMNFGSRARNHALAARRPSTVGIALAAIVLVFTAAFLSLSQSVRVAATGYDIVRLASEHDRLQAIRQDLQSDVERLRSEPAIRKQALDAGLGQLGAPLVVPAR